MFNYTHAVVCNSAAELTAALKDYKAANIINHKPDGTTITTAFVEKGTAGTPGTYTIAVAGTAVTPAPADTNIVSNRILVKISAPTKELSDYANANWQEFSRCFMAEGLDATALENNLCAVIADMADEKPFSVSGGVITLAKNWMKADIYVEGLNANDEVVKANAIAATAEPVAPKYDYEFMCSNVQFPTYYNMRYNSVNPKIDPNAIYDCYTFNYKVDRPGLGGLSGVGQVMQAETTHVFYVKNDVAASGVLAGAVDVATL